MPLYDLKCQTCDRVFEAFVALVDYPATPPCPTCASPTDRVLLPPPSPHTLPDSTVVYRASDGSFRFPGETGGASCAKYEAMGYERIEARGWAETRRLEAKLNAHERSQLARAEERRSEAQEQMDSLRRSEIRRGLEQGFRMPEQRMCEDGQVRPTGRMITVHMRQQGRDAMRHAMARNEQRGHRRIGEPGIHVDAYSNYRGNRDESRDRDGRRRRD